MESHRLYMQSIVKEFPGVKALDGVDFALQPGEVHALLGINGAGKSTLIKILSGVYQKDGGEIFMDGQSIEIANPQEAIKHGIATVYQDPHMVPSFTGYENIFLGYESEKTGLFPRINRKQLRKKAEQLLQRFPVEIDLNKPVAQLEAVEKEIVAVLRALSRDMSILVLDEPTSILTEHETTVLFELINILKERDVSIIYITHRLEEIEQIADRLTVFRDGKNVATLDVKEHGADHLKIAELMLGKKIDTIYPEKTTTPGADLFSAQKLALNGCFQDVSFTVRQGEILGIFGLVGSGIDDLSKVLFGVFPRTQGEITLHGQTIRLRSPKDAIRQGIFLVPGDRRQEGQIGNEAVSFNVSLSNLKRVSGLLGAITRRKERPAVQTVVDQLGVTPSDIAMNISLLSGGNQQKVVIGKGLFSDGDVYIFEEPTVGVDVGAKAGIYSLIRELSHKTAVIVISSDCEEVFGVSDRVMVMYKGQVTMDKHADDVRLEEMLLYGVTGGQVHGHENTNARSA
ncbi:MAG: sugar ABC transporter ATP-binding protein [bacterium]|nr:sugar ABC transporter ATP-binding protein [bacterium]